MIFENTKHAILNTIDEIPHLSFPVLSKFSFLRHGFSTKLGGVSTDIFASMNLGSETSPLQDNPANIEENYRRIAKSIGFDVNSVVVSFQVHKTNILAVDEKDCGKGLFVPRDFDEIDGLITNRPNVTLVTKYADCVPLYFVDPIKKAIGLSHAGWRGTVSKIGAITAAEMIKQYGCEPSDLIAVVGPSICKDCYEIGEETANEFKKAFSEDQIKNILFPISDFKGKYLCDLWAANHAVLLEAGLLAENIHISGVCTACHSDLLFSHRKTQGKRGSLAAFLSMV
ncbi:MAG: peptidoglycan editing factor PgeF [Mobilitalea sp.]